MAKVASKAISDAIAPVVATLDIAQIQRMPRERLLALQERLGFGSSWGVWRVPSSWMPHSMRAPGIRTVKLDPSSTEFDKTWIEILRFALLATLSPRNRQ